MYTPSPRLSAGSVGLNADAALSHWIRHVADSDPARIRYIQQQRKAKWRSDGIESEAEKYERSLRENI